MIYLRNFIPSLLFTLTAALCSLWWCGWPELLTDDAYIYLDFARNLTEGNGIVFFKGGPVAEGYSSPVWLIISCLAILLPGNPESWLRLVSVLFTTFSLSLVLSRIQTPLLNYRQFLAASSLIFATLLFSAGYFFWMTTAGLETSLWSFGIVSLFCFSTNLKEKNNSSVFLLFLFFLLPFFRPEAILLGPFWILLIYLKFRGEGKKSSPLSYVISFLAGLLLLILWRIWYFGFIFPNTVYAKFSNNWLENLREGFSYFFEFLLYSPLVSVSLISGALLLYTGIRSHGLLQCLKSNSVFAFLMVAPVILLPILHGGDQFPGFRFYQPVLGLILAIPFLSEYFAVLVFNPEIRNLRRNAFFFWIFFFLMGLTSGMKLNLSADLRSGQFEFAENYRETGRRINLIYSGKEKPLVAQLGVGALEWEYNGPVMDCAGLTDPEMAHSTVERIGPRGHTAFDATIFFKRMPEVVLPWPAASMHDSIRVADFTREAMKNIFEEEEFKDNYKAKVVCDENGRNCVAGWWKSAKN